MSRAHLDYTQRRIAAPSTGFDPDRPIAGLYQMRLVSGGVFVPVKIWFGAPLDPVTGEELDRSHRWNATANGDAVTIERVWPRCAADAIDQTEFAYLMSRKVWAETHAPTAEIANPTRRVDPLQSPILF